ncbi:MAG: hypothetical protein HOV68_29440, partial [Streptomycetaceae bacterium]|nr:hypothetical protein [Streptomycetaceae bacterium]
MTTTTEGVRRLAFLLEHGAPADRAAILARLPPETRAALSHVADEDAQGPTDLAALGDFRDTDEREDVEDLDRHPLVLGLRSGAFTASEVARKVPYAAGLLRTFEALESQVGVADRPAPPQLAQLRDALADLVRTELGTGPDHWRAVLAYLSADEFPGTLPELFAAARRGPGPAYDKRPWPHVQQVSSSPFTHLLRCADPAALPGILGALDPHDLGEVAHYDIQQPLPAALVDAFLEHAGPDCVAAFVPHHAHDPRTQERLLARGDPGLNAVLLRNCEVSSRVWYTVAAGPPHPAVTEVLRGGPRRPSGVDPLRYAVHTRDADLIRDALRLPHGTLTTAHQITGCRRLLALGHGADLAALAHRHGPLDPLLATVIRTAPARAGSDALAR